MQSSVVSAIYVKSRPGWKWQSCFGKMAHPPPRTRPFVSVVVERVGRIEPAICKPRADWLSEPWLANYSCCRERAWQALTLVSYGRGSYCGTEQTRANGDPMLHQRLQSTIAIRNVALRSFIGNGTTTVKWRSNTNSLKSLQAEKKFDGVTVTRNSTDMRQWRGTQ